ncbi:hypothetical protein MUCCIDRAFT_81058 [Mucor lusitanicus CBS 277.49]|uniref:Uncharacterized protein n=1 Tax=Mucor lusitanicus CBS 277.49 TaxID=747725 RepID=A0A168L2Q1_MUCCL|nr:hypothetical protein MUCCIDRAFT_81058 [Mucor lusitanicus CBS 277.49]
MSSNLVQCIQDQASYYRKLKAELDSESNVQNALDDAKLIRLDFEKAIQSKKAEINSLEEYSKKEYRDVRRMRHLSFRSAAATLSGKKKERTAKEEAKYQLAFENEQRSKRELDELQTSYQGALAREEELVRQKSHFEDTKHQFDSLLEQIFMLEDPNFPLEPQLKAELVNYKEQKRLAKRDKNRFSEAEQALSTALVDIKKVIRLLDTVINYVPFEIFGGPIIDEEQVAYLEAAKRRIWEIQRLMNIARTVLPEIPYPQTLDVVTNNTLLQMQLNLNYIDIAWKAYRNTQNSLTWVKQYKDYAAGALVRLDEAVNVIKESLKTERRRIMDTVLAGHTGGDGASSSAAADNPPLFSTTYHNANDPPPPVYEAPPVGEQYNNQSQGAAQSDQHLPAIPANLTPATSFLNLPMNEDSNTAITNSSLMPPITSHENNNGNAPPHPITPVFEDTSMPSSPPPPQAHFFSARCGLAITGGLFNKQLNAVVDWLMNCFEKYNT